ncbi:MAG: SUMF1/EgtB/PvdO family nonheme iron enzyme [Myxococcales bacterium]|nr:SUMF1/EgtB/PvdO family nonheme iron enzyme [Myxococcales bacterium]
MSSVESVLRAVFEAPPSAEALRRAALIWARPSPAMIENAARYLEMVEALRAERSAVEVAEILCDCLEGKAGTPPPHPVLEDALFAMSPAEGAALATERLPRWRALAAEGRRLPFVLLHAQQARHGEPLDDAVLDTIPPAPQERSVRAVLSAVSPAKREAWLLDALNLPLLRRSAANQAPGFAVVRLSEYVVPHLDLCDAPTLRAAVAEALAIAAPHEAAAALRRRVEAGGGPTPPVTEPTPEALRGLADLEQKHTEARRAAGIVGVVQQSLDRGVRVTHAPELLDLDAWRAATDARRRALADQVAAAHPDLRLLGVRRYAEDTPVAVFYHRAADLDLALIPGHDAQVGFGDHEEAVVRAASLAHAGIPNHFEEFEYFLTEGIASMRPVRRVRVGPFLIATAPGPTLDPAPFVDHVEASPFRLPSEAEWEAAARGGRPDGLTFRGDDVPDEAWFEETESGGEELANAFGCYGFGLMPEVCADAWHSDHHDAPPEGRPRPGPGPRVVRGGAAQVYPWQSCGEWQLLCVACRAPDSHWEFFRTFRPTWSVHVEAQD